MAFELRKWLFSSPPAEWALNQVRELLIGALRQGPIPKHVAFVMDGNRRFARSHRIETVEGHNLGFEALARILEVCYKSGVTHVTIYAFSIENFKRPKYEVDALMDMAKIKLTQLSQHGDLLDRYGASVRILGQRELIKADVLEAVDRAVEMTAQNNKAVLNVCFPYTSREEIATAIRSTVEEWSRPIQHTSSDRGRKSSFKEDRITHTIRSQHLSDYSNPSASATTTSTYLQPSGLHSPTSSTTSLASSLSNSESYSTISSSTTLHPDNTEPSSPKTMTSAFASPALSSPPHFSTPGSAPPRAYPSPELITPGTLTAHTFTGRDNNPPLDLLIRTSGVERLSDFMLWQCHESTQIVFLSVLWPQFDLWSFLPVLWEWQWRIQKESRKARALDDGDFESRIE